VGGASGPPKREQFRTLEAAGFATPPHGLVGDVLGSWWEAEKCWVKWVVAYTDEAAHCAEGKEVWWKQCAALNWQPRMGYDARNERANRNSETVYCSAFVGCYPQLGRHGRPAVSLRRLQVGRHVFWVEYKSTESWMSNFGEGTCEVVGQEWDAGYHPYLRLPLFAVDLVWGGADLYAVDFNTAPGIRGSGVEKLLPGPECVRVLEQALEDLG
jgi:hypothetical protein